MSNKTIYLKPLKKLKHFGCLNCSWGELAEGRILKVRMDYTMEPGFLVPDRITRDGKAFFDANELKDWEIKTMAQIEEEVCAVPGDWRLHIDMALRSAVYQRQGKNKWVLVKTGNGFA